MGMNDVGTFDDEAASDGTGLGELPGGHLDESCEVEHRVVHVELGVAVAVDDVFESIGGAVDATLDTRRHACCQRVDDVEHLRPGMHRAQG
jgi:hypothetical protein